MSASERDLQAYVAYRRYRSMSHGDHDRAISMAMGRGEWASREMLVEAIARAEDELLTLPSVQRWRGAQLTFGMSEAAARADALDHAWGLVEAARQPGPAAGGGSGAEALIELERVWGAAGLSESTRQQLTRDAGWDGTKIVDEARFAAYVARRSAVGPIDLTEAERETLEGRRGVRVSTSSRPKSKPGEEPSFPVELKEVPDDRAIADRLRESFAGMGLSEEAARIAAEGRGT